MNISETTEGSLQQHVHAAFAQFTGTAPAFMVRSPGRINLIGEHTDYNNGFVLPAAVGQSIYLAAGFSPNPDRCRIRSVDFDESFELDLADIRPFPPGTWKNYIAGVVAGLSRSHSLRGIDLVFGGDIPIGAGMSSSAALECGVCLLLNEIFGLGLSRKAMARISQTAEHTFAGVHCGIMDQFASLMGRENNALMLDCQSLDYTLYPFQAEGFSIVLYNSNVTHSLASSGYNTRRQECEAGVKVLAAHYAPVETLRDVTLEQLQAVREEMDPVVYRRCRYVLEENRRVADFATAMQAGDLGLMGLLLKASQEAMRTEYEITCPEIDFMAEYTNRQPGVYGARMMGGGFGGCIICLVETAQVDALTRGLRAAYADAYGRQTDPVPVEISDGVRLVEHPSEQSKS